MMVRSSMLRVRDLWLVTLGSGGMEPGFGCDWRGECRIASEGATDAVGLGEDSFSDFGCVLWRCSFFCVL